MRESHRFTKNQLEKSNVARGKLNAEENILFNLIKHA